MTEISRFWDDTVLGDCGPYTSAHMHDEFFRSILNGTGDRGVLLGWLNELEVTGTSSPLSVASGGAIIYGLFYENDAPVSISVPTPAAGYSRYDYIVVRRSWSTQTARIALVAGTPYSFIPVYPTLTQTPGSIYEIPLARLVITDAGTITVTTLGMRQWCTFSTQWGVGTADDPDYFQDGAVTADKIPDRYRYFIKEAAQLEPDSANPATWNVGASYDHWLFADAVTNAVWLYDFVPRDQAGTTVAVYLWSVPDVNGAGGGAENVRWVYNYALSGPEAVAAFTTNPTLVDQQLRVNTTVYRDLLVTLPSATSGQMIMLQISRTGGDAADSYASDMRLLGVELYYSAEA